MSLQQLTETTTNRTAWREKVMMVTGGRLTTWRHDVTGWVMQDACHRVASPCRQVTRQTLAVDAAPQETDRFLLMSSSNLYFGIPRSSLWPSHVARCCFVISCALDVLPFILLCNNFVLICFSIDALGHLNVHCIFSIHRQNQYFKALIFFLSASRLSTIQHHTWPIRKSLTKRRLRNGDAKLNYSLGIYLDAQRN